MKYLLLALTIVIIVFVSCQKELTEFVPNSFDTTILPVDTSVLNANIDSVHWVATKNIKAEFIPGDVANGIPALISISGISNDNRKLQFGMADSGKGIYLIFAQDVSFNGAQYSDSTSITKGSFYTNDGPSLSRVGAITLTDIDTINKTISGTFNFKVYRTSDTTLRNITNGSFNKLPYTGTAGSIPSAITDTFSVKINDTILMKGYTIIPIVANEYINLNAYDSLGVNKFEIAFPDTLINPVKDTTYTFNAPSTLRTIKYTRNDTIEYQPASNTGQLKILEYNSVSKRIRASFSFIGKRNATDSAKLTEGYFSVEYP